MPRITTTEGSLLAKIRQSFPKSPKRSHSILALGIGDDAALFRPARGHETIFTCDWFLEGTHFLRDKHAADAVGWKCLARAVSDIAAMGGLPRGFLMSIALPSNATGEWFAEFLGGLRRAAKILRCELAGGDSTQFDRILINITVVGEIKKGRALRRDGAQVGDAIFVSGRLGEAERGLHLLQSRRQVAKRSDATRDPNLRKHLYPEPRLALGQWLVANRLASAAMDLSDGLSTDLSRLCAASNVGARIDPARIPTVNLSATPTAGGRSAPRAAERRTAQRKTKPAPQDAALNLALHGGDDYELLFTVPAKKSAQIPPTFGGTVLSQIGEITSTRKILLVGNTHIPTVLQPAGWDPFR